MTSSVAIRKAVSGDELRISGLYQEVYQGTYPDPTMTQISLLADALRRPDYLWIIAEDTTPSGQHDSASIIGSVVYRIDAANLLAKVFGAVVLPHYRGENLTQRLMNYGVELMQRAGDDIESLDSAIEIIYATTRTVTPVPQKLTASLGYKKLGLFPNVHKTEEYETHCLTALLLPKALAKRHTEFELHARIAPLYELVRRECGLGPIPVLADPPIVKLTERSQAPAFELINAPHFVRHRFNLELKDVAHHQWFFPFQEPNILLTTPDQEVEVFAFLSPTDKHCVLMGIRDRRGIGLENILEPACRFLRAHAARYLEIIVRADEAHTIETALQADFIPSAYFPSLHLHQGVRYDFVVFSRSFEILDFKHIRLEGLNLRYLELYYDHWRQVALTESLENRR